MTKIAERVAQTLALPAFWRGATNARLAIYASGDDSLLNSRGIIRAQTIELKRSAGCPLDDIEEFAEWCAIGGGWR